MATIGRFGRRFGSGDGEMEHQEGGCNARWMRSLDYHFLLAKLNTFLTWQS